MLNDPQTLVAPHPLAAPAEAGEDGVLIAGRYRLLHPLGFGGMGQVFLAEDQLLARRVALKSIRPELCANEEVRSRIKRECRLHAAIGVHPHIVALHDTVEECGQLSLIMEYFAGQTLAGLMAGAPAGLPLATALDITRQVLLALSCIHNQGIVHRDIKTANILLQARTDGQYLVKLTDFGIARAAIAADAQTRLTSVGVQGPGTPVYMAPERIDCQTFGEISPATDLYAVGIILFELLTGTPPFNGTMTEIFSGHLLQPPALATLPSGLPAQLHAVLATALTKQPGQRYQHAEEFSAAVAAIHIGAGAAPGQATKPLVQPAATLLSPCPEAAGPELPTATMLHPSLGRDRQPLSSLWRRAWLPAAIAGALLLGGFLLHGYRPAPLPGGPLPDGAEAQRTAAQDPAAPVPAPGEPAEPKNASALEALEQGRGEKRSESMVAAERGAASAAGEWQVVEDRSRRVR